MITFTRDPISLNDVVNLDQAPFVIEGAGPNQLKIYFESEANKLEYLDTPIHGPLESKNLDRIFNEMAENPDTGSIN